MKKLLTSAQMRECDSYTSEHFGVPSVVLMERAALAACDALVAFCELNKDKRVLVLCGTGNNGADGLALSRILFENDISVSYHVPFDTGKHSELFDKQSKIVENYGVLAISSGTTLSVADLEEYDVIVDALFGIGLSRKLSADICSFIEKVNNARAIRVAIDIPSGINADTGAIMGEAFKADLTVTFGFAKTGLMLYPGRKYTGKLVLAQIGITEKSLGSVDTYLYEEIDVINSLPVRPNDGNKGTFGKVLIFAGSPEMTGAGIMAAKAAYRAGAGMVKVITYEENAQIIQSALPEAMVTAVSAEEEEIKLDEIIATAVNWADSILIGPGIGLSQTSLKVMTKMIKEAGDKPIIIDADGLNLIAMREELPNNKEELPNIISMRKGFTVFTPHVGELSRLIRKPVEEIKTDFICSGVAGATKYGVYMVAKDSITLVTEGNDKTIIASGNNGMATAGSGDVLSGIIAALVAFKNPEENKERRQILEEAVKNAVYIHGMAGTECLKHMPEDSIMAGDMTNMIPTVVSRIRNSQNSCQNQMS